MRDELQAHREMFSHPGVVVAIGVDQPIGDKQNPSSVLNALDQQIEPSRIAHQEMNIAELQVLRDKLRVQLAEQTHSTQYRVAVIKSAHADLIANLDTQMETEISRAIELQNIRLGQRCVDEFAQQSGKVQPRRGVGRKLRRARESVLAARKAVQCLLRSVGDLRAELAMASNARKMRIRELERELKRLELQDDVDEDAAEKRLKRGSVQQELSSAYIKGLRREVRDLRSQGDALEAGIARVREEDAERRREFRWCRVESRAEERIPPIPKEQKPRRPFRDLKAELEASLQTRHALRLRQAELRRVLRRAEFSVLGI